MSSKDLLSGVIIGVAAGVVLGVLFAPDKGSETRKKIKVKGEELADAIKEKYEDLSEVVADKYESAKEKISEFVKGNEAEDVLEEARANAAAMRNDVRDTKPVIS